MTDHEDLEVRPLSAPVEQPRKLTPRAVATASGVLAGLVLLLVAEFRGIFSRREGDTLSEFLWALLGDRYSLRWCISYGLLLGLIAWMALHFGLGGERWGWRELLDLAAGSVFTLVLLYLFHSPQ